MKGINKKLSKEEIEYIKNNFSYNPITGEVRRNKARQKRHIGIVGWSGNCGHLLMRVRSNQYLVHRIAWILYYGKEPINFIDHINGIPFDNRISNLRDVTQSQNMQNRRKPSKSSTTGYLGVTRQYYNTKNKRITRFVSQITVRNINIYIGRFKTAEEASIAYQKKKKELHIKQLVEN